MFLNISIQKHSAKVKKNVAQQSTCLLSSKIIMRDKRRHFYTDKMMYLPSKKSTKFWHPI